MRAFELLPSHRHVHGQTSSFCAITPGAGPKRRLPNWCVGPLSWCIPPRCRWPAARGVDPRRPPRYARRVRHELTDVISLEMGRRVAARLRQQPDLLRLAHDNLDRWTRLNANAPSLLRCYEEWRGILNRRREEIGDLLTSETEEARRLRQNSPFAGVLSAREVWELKQRFRHATTAA